MSSPKMPHLPVKLAFLLVFPFFISAASAATKTKFNMFKCGDDNGIPTAYIKAKHQVRSKLNCAVLCSKYGDVCENMHYVPSIKDSDNCFIGSAVNLNRGYGTCTGLVNTTGAVSFYRKVECGGGSINQATGACECQQGYGGSGCTTRINDCHDTTTKNWHTVWAYPPGAPAPFQVKCYSQITFIMIRNWDSQATVSFNRSYEEYAAGFDDPNKSDFYLGNRNIHYLTNWTRGQHISLKLYRHQAAPFMRYYNHMKVMSEADQFRITIANIQNGQATDTDGDALLSTTPGLSIKEMPFTTYDKDQDNWADGNCASKFGGGWWYNNCTAAPLTAKLMNSDQITTGGGPDNVLHVDWTTQSAANRTIGISMIMFGFFTF